MTEHVGADNRKERREDLTSVIADALPAALDKALPPALERALWGDMRPARKWAEIRAYLEMSIKDHETRVRRLEVLKQQSAELGRNIVKDIVIHVVVSTGVMSVLFAMVYKFIISGATK